ncbi:MAG: acyloxyacyl hydrolase [Planctomycetota bacterium]
MEWSPVDGTLTPMPVLAQTPRVAPPEDTPTTGETAEASGWLPEAFVSIAYGDEGEFYTAHAGAERLFDPVNRFAVVPQLGAGLTRNTDGDYPAVVSFDLQLRWYFWEPAGWRLFLEGGGGLQYVGPESFPRSGTHFNGRLRAGVGARYRLDDRLDLLGGVGWLHVSNANVLPVNVGHDGPMFFLGLSKSF